SPDVDELPPLQEHYGDLKAFGWDYERKDVIKWAAEHGHPNENYVNALSELMESLPESHIRITRVRDNKTYGDKFYRMVSSLRRTGVEVVCTS
ncbi:hypothetical protein C0989_011995, partial [Termitomyces sp. Mn162]